MGILDGQVAFISGGARGQGRSHAVRLAEEGADIVTFDICENLDTVAYACATDEDLDTTVKLVENLGRRIIARKADVRDFDALQAVFDEGIAEFGRVDIVLANAGIMPVIGDPGRRREAWIDAIDVMLTGAWNTCEVAIPTLVDQGEGGSIVITSSTAGSRATLRTLAGKSHGMLGYYAAKHGVVGLMRAYANMLGPHSIRCNTVHPTGVNTPMIVNAEFEAHVQENPAFAGAAQNALPVPMVEPRDISNTILHLCSDAGRYITGSTVAVDAGAINY